MVNYLRFLENPQLDPLPFLHVMRDFRKGGLNPSNFEKFMNLVGQLPPIINRTQRDYDSFEELKLTDLSEEDFPVIMREVINRVTEEAKTCWHPLSGKDTCNLNSNGKPIISKAHSIQENGVLSQIAENGQVLGYSVAEGNFSTKIFGKGQASIFWGFCNKHDAVFKPIEIAPYIKSDEQNFLFAYRAFVVSCHKKVEASRVINFGDSSLTNIYENKKIFDEALLKSDFSCIETKIIELPTFYPLTVSTCFYLDFDFWGRPIKHSQHRMEYLFLTVLPVNDRTFFLLSYFKLDSFLYSQLGSQLIVRDNLKSDISVLVAGHVENIFFNPSYYRKYIESQRDNIKKLVNETQFDLARIDGSNNLQNITSCTPYDYFTNKYGISLFAY